MYVMLGVNIVYDYVCFRNKEKHRRSLLHCKQCISTCHEDHSSTCWRNGCGKYFQSVANGGNAKEETAIQCNTYKGNDRWTKCCGWRALKYSMCVLWLTGFHWWHCQQLRIIFTSGLRDYTWDLFDFFLYLQLILRFTCKLKIKQRWIGRVNVYAKRIVFINGWIRFSYLENSQTVSWFGEQ